MNYLEKLKSPKWQKKRLEVLNRDKFTCCTCGDTETELHVHHLKYTKEPYDAPLEDLQTLCKHCHKYFTFHHLDNLSTFELLKNSLKKIIKINNCMIISYNDATLLYYIDNDNLTHVACFSKKSNILKELFNINQNG